MLLWRHISIFRDTLAIFYANRRDFSSKFNIQILIIYDKINSDSVISEIKNRTSESEVQVSSSYYKYIIYTGRLTSFLNAKIDEEIKTKS